MHVVAVGSWGFKVKAVAALGVVTLAALLLPATGSATPIAATTTLTPTATLTTPVPTQAGGHPNVTVHVDFCGATTPCKPSVHGTLKNLLIHLPPGLIANPEATPKCTEGSPTCLANTQVGTIAAAVETESDPTVNNIDGQIYNQPPHTGELARFGIYLPGFPGTPPSVGFGLGADGGITQSALDFPQQVAGQQIKIRTLDYTLSGIANGNPFVYNPTVCTTQQASIEANSWEDATFTTATTTYTNTGCNSLPPLVPTTTLTPVSQVAGQPSGYTFTIDTGFNAGADPIQSHIRDTQVAFPQGLTLSASGGGQLDSCTPAQLASSSCPADSIVGDITVNSPFVDHPITGHAYFGVPTDSEPYPVLFGFDSSGVGVQLQSTSNVNEQTGQITAITIDQPQLPFSTVEIELRGGDYAVLANPYNCGSYHATSTFTPWSGQNNVVSNSPDFAINQGFGHNCPSARGFSPTLGATLSDTSARAHTHLRTLVERNQNDQQLTGLKIETPPGLTATLAEVPHCARAQALAGTCGDESKIGDINVLAGNGNTPLAQQGKMFLTDPINDGDVIGFSFVIPARAGNVNFGNVVTTSGVKLSAGGDTATTDATAIPKFFKGIPIPIRKIDVDLNSDHFLINPSNCDPKEFKGELFSDESAQVPATAPIQITGCDALPFAPKLKFSANAKGQPKYNNQKWHPEIRATVTQQPGEAALKYTRTAIPDILRPNITGVQKNLCQGATLRNCPVTSRVGEATVETPLLSQPLSGYMYLLQEPGKILPKIALALDGPVSVDVDSRNAIEGIRTVNYFENIPDVPVRKVDFLFYGGTGTNGILNAFSDLCAEKSYGDVDFRAHNGKRVVERPLLNVTGCPPVAKLSIKKRKLKVSRRGVVKLKLKCGSKEKCAGSASLQTGKAAKQSKVKTLGKGKVKIKPRKTGTVKIKLNKKALKQVRKRKKMRVNVSVSLERQPTQSVGKVTLAR